MRLTVPKYFQHNHIAALYLGLSKLPSDAHLTLSFEQCLWADHFELQKLAVLLASLSTSLKKLSIHCYAQESARESREQAENRKRTIDVIDYSNRIGFFKLLHCSFGARLKLQCGDRLITASTTTDLEKQLADVLPVRRVDSGEHRSYVPIHSLTDHSSVERLTKTFSTGTQIQELVEHNAGLDFVSSGEFATLVVHELLQNAVEHAWPTGSENRIAVVSLSTVSSRHRDNRESRLNIRSQYGPTYEHQFLKHLRGPGYLELCVSDNGVGIISTLRTCADSWPDWFAHGEIPSDAELLASAFWAKVTRDSGPHRPGHRGLYFVFESVRENAGMVVCQSEGFQLTAICNDPDWLMAHGERAPLTPTSSDEIQDLRPRVSGTHLRVLLPLIGSGAGRRFWMLRFPQAADVTWPTDCQVNIGVEALPLPPTSTEMETDVRRAMESFRAACKEVVGKAASSIDGYDGRVSWMSASHTRFWRKQHIQTLLEEILSEATLKVVFLVNLPASQFQSFLFVARYVATIEAGKLIFLLDESGKRTIIYRQHNTLIEGFMRWAAEGGNFVAEQNHDSEILLAFAQAFSEQYPGLSLTRVQFAAISLGIQTEFEPLLESFRDTNRVILIDKDCFVKGYIELDEALRDAGFLRAVASLVQLARRFLIRAKGTIVVRRAATRLTEVYGSLDDKDAWIMETPTRENAPSAEWVLRHDSLCIVTDVVCRGNTLVSLINEIGIGSQLALHQIRLAIVAPLIMDLEGWINPATNHAIQHSASPGLSYLQSKDFGPIPIIWAMHSTALFQGQQGLKKGPKPDLGTNILFESTEGTQTDGEGGQMEAGTFIRFAEHQNALWLGHLTITGEHFDLEFNMSRLLREGSNILSRFVETVIESIAEIHADTILFPDESRIQLALAAIEDALQFAGKVIPRIIRMRRSTSGEMFLRKSDEESLRQAKSILLLDDAVNSGGTARQMLSKATEFVAVDAVFCFCVVVSRQPQDSERLFFQITGLSERSFKYRPLVRIPVTFFSVNSCPYCRMKDVAKALAIGLGPRSQVSALMHELADRLEADKAYTKSAGHSRLEPSVSYNAPSPTPQGLVLEHFATLAGAKTAIACSLGSRAEIDLPFFLSVLNHCPTQLNLRSYAFYAACSRSSSARSFIDSPEFLREFNALCKALGNAAPNGEGGADPLVASVLDMCLTCWFVGTQRRAALLASIIRNCVKYLTNSKVYEWTLFLAFSLSEKRESREDKLTLIGQAIEDARRSQTQKDLKSASRLSAIERLMRLRQLAQAASAHPISEPWLDGVVTILERLSYKAGHEFLSFVNRRDVSWAQSLSETLGAFPKEDRNLSGNRTFVEFGEEWSDMERFLNHSQSDVSFLAGGLVHSLGSWFKAVDYGGQLNRSVKNLLDALAVCETYSSEFVAALIDARTALRFGKVDQLSGAFAKMADLQKTLYTLLYDQTDSESLRSAVELLLCPVYDLESSFAGTEIERELASLDCQVSATGSFFEYCDRVKHQGTSGEKPRWNVLLAPPSLVNDILRDVLVQNPKKHILERLPKNSQVKINADIEGFDSMDHRTRFRVSVFVNGVMWGVPLEIWHKTLGRNRDVLLHVYGGTIRVEASESGHGSTVIVEFLSGHF